MQFFQDPYHIITYDILYDSIYSFEINCENCLKNGHRLTDLFRDRK